MAGNGLINNLGEQTQVWTRQFLTWAEVYLRKGFVTLETLAQAGGVPGQLLTPPAPTFPSSTDGYSVTGGAWNESEYWGSWGPITYTPPVDAWALLIVKAAMAANAAGVKGAVAINQTAPSSTTLVQSGFVYMAAAYYDGYEVSAERLIQLTGGVTYTWHPVLLWSATCTGYIYSDGYLSHFEVIPWRKP